MGCGEALAIGVSAEFASELSPGQAKDLLREPCTALKGKRTWTGNLNDSSTTISTKHLQETLERTLSSSDIGLLLLYLKENGAIKAEWVDAQMFQVATKELFRDGVLIFFEVLVDISRQNEIK